MKHNLHIHFLLSVVLAFLAISNALGQNIGSWQTPPATACAFQQTTLVLSYTAAENVTGLAGQTIDGANLIQAPSLNTTNRTITLVV